MDNKEKETRTMEIDIVPILKLLLFKLWLIVLVGVIVGAAVYGITKIMIKPVYRSGFSAYINNQQSQQTKDSLTSSDINAAQQLTRTYSYMLKSDTILTAAADSINLDLSYSVLKYMVSTEIQPDTEIIAVYVTDLDPQLAYDYAVAISKTAPDYMADFVEGSSMKIIDHPVYSDRRYRPSYIKYGWLGFLGGAILVAIIVIIRHFRDDTIKNEAELEQCFPYPVLGIIPDAAKSNSAGSDYYYYAQDKATPINEGKEGDK